MDWDSYYAHVQQVYDHIADEYDSSVGRYAVSLRAKQLALKIIRDATPTEGCILDLGCYTGTEAVILAREGYRVVGVDISPRMIEIAKRKAKKWRLEDRLRFATLRASELLQLGEKLDGPVDTVYSVYGTLNLEPQLDAFKAGLCRVLREDGQFIVGLLSPSVLYELVIAPIFLKFHGYRKLSRYRVKTRTGLGSGEVETFLYSPGEFIKRMSPELEPERVLGVHFLYPPPHGKGGGGRWWVARTLDSLEVRLQERFPFSGLGFFSLLTFRMNR